MAAAGDLVERIRSRFALNGLLANAGQVDQLSGYIGLLTKWNSTVNLTALPLDPLSDKAIDRLLVEPFLATSILVTGSWFEIGSPELSGSVRTGDAGEMAQPAQQQQSAEPMFNLRILDIGSGGGSPAIPLHIALPGSRLQMVESRSRKAAFLREVARHLGLSSASVLNERLEDLRGVGELIGAADVVSLRAVRADREFWAAVSAFVRPGGLVLWFTSGVGGDIEREFDPLFYLEATVPLGTGDSSQLAILRRGCLGSRQKGLGLA